MPRVYRSKKTGLIRHYEDAPAKQPAPTAKKLVSRVPTFKDDDGPDSGGVDHTAPQLFWVKEAGKAGRYTTTPTAAEVKLADAQEKEREDQRR